MFIRSLGAVWQAAQRGSGPSCMISLATAVLIVQVQRREGTASLRIKRRSTDESGLSPFEACKYVSKSSKSSPMSSWNLLTCCCQSCLIVGESGLISLYSWKQPERTIIRLTPAPSSQGLQKWSWVYINAHDGRSCAVSGSWP